MNVQETHMDGYFIDGRGSEDLRSELLFSGQGDVKLLLGWTQGSNVVRAICLACALGLG